MFVGQDRAGKTSLKKSFLGLPFDPTQQSTDGIDVDSSKCEYEGDRMTNWKLTDEMFGISQHLDDIAKIAAKQIEDEETEAQPQAELSPDVSKETKHKENKVSRSKCVHISYPETTADIWRREEWLKKFHTDDYPDLGSASDWLK